MVSNAFMTAFEEIDDDCSGEITREELTAYMKKKNYKPIFVEKWLKIFDADNSGTITIEEFCDTLGLVPKEEYLEQVKTNREMTALDDATIDGVRIITIDPDMTEETKDDLIQLARRGQAEFAKERDIAKHIKEQLDLTFSCNWHVIVGRFQYGSYVSHEQGCLLHFWVDRYAILLWKTPDYGAGIYQ